MRTARLRDETPQRKYIFCAREREATRIQIDLKTRLSTADEIGHNANSYLKVRILLTHWLELGQMSLLLNQANDSIFKVL